jgi:hypothetical protein
VKYNYLLIRVEETDDTGKHFSAAAHLRGRIHKLAKDMGINVADNIIKFDSAAYPWGAKVPYTEAEDLFVKIMGR